MLVTVGRNLGSLGFLALNPGIRWCRFFLYFLACFSKLVSFPLYCYKPGTGKQLFAGAQGSFVEDILLVTENVNSMQCTVMELWSSNIIVAMNF